jgi:hypothetical protein
MLAKKNLLGCKESEFGGTQVEKQSYRWLKYGTMQMRNNLNGVLSLEATQQKSYRPLFTHQKLHIHTSDGVNITLFSHQKLHIHTSDGVSITLFTHQKLHIHTSDGVSITLFTHQKLHIHTSAESW